jgi:hypothetical protein
MAFGKINKKLQGFFAAVFGIMGMNSHRSIQTGYGFCHGNSLNGAFFGSPYDHSADNTCIIHTLYHRIEISVINPVIEMAVTVE